MSIQLYYPKTLSAWQLLDKSMKKQAHKCLTRVGTIGYVYEVIHCLKLRNLVGFF